MEYSKIPVIYKKILKAYIAFVLEGTSGKMMILLTFLLRKEFLFLMNLIWSYYYKILYRGKKQGQI